MLPPWIEPADMNDPLNILLMQEDEEAECEARSTTLLGTQQQYHMRDLIDADNQEALSGRFDRSPGKCHRIHY